MSDANGTPAAQPHGQQVQPHGQQVQLQTDLDLRTLAEGFYLQALDQLSTSALDEPSPLPGWTRKHVAIHMINNAEGLMRLLEWARTGQENPMYPSREARDQDIEDGVAQTPAGDVRSISHEVAQELAEALAGLAPEAWDAQVTGGQGQPIGASAIPWMRAREALLHSLDLGIGMTALDFPAAAVDRLLDDVPATWAARGEDAHFLLRLADRPEDPERLIATGDAQAFAAQPVEVVGEAAEVASYLAGRGWPRSAQDDTAKGGQGSATPQDLPAPPRWL
ncbi:maleylpyruvate isomerase family mycothiol-dependent enzyme [Brevibacterium sp. 5221]|uniref:Maleylpyruvate isomerase family mycothiol-dependent enzyme n=1 Tax=Brevibacterium rongguiense TaxID=2695267 RepID=A0A6N9H8J7_9MICO|nr:MULTISPECIES: maleylpyruvate isomerase N-terminal domain-containing protein [Brevibacterium]MYM20313.1 maleylpyruvate isomerase family mycothiol-dependent enzyme [Brevibacterium rongguiense]WAL39276.1 maleylpyruvate isomerase N-terminal domain-containing protein [Brevibacterium sp. BRM-1]